MKNKSIYISTTTTLQVLLGQLRTYLLPKIIRIYDEV